MKPLTPQQHRSLAFFGLGVIGPCVVGAFFFMYVGRPELSWVYFGLTLLVAVVSILNYRRSLE